MQINQKLKIGATCWVGGRPVGGPSTDSGTVANGISSLSPAPELSPAVPLPAALAEETPILALVGGLAVSEAPDDGCTGLPGIVSPHSRSKSSCSSFFGFFKPGFFAASSSDS